MKLAKEESYEMVIRHTKPCKTVGFVEYRQTLTDYVTVYAVYHECKVYIEAFKCYYHELKRRLEYFKYNCIKHTRIVQCLIAGSERKAEREVIAQVDTILRSPGLRRYKNVHLLNTTISMWLDRTTAFYPLPSSTYLCPLCIASNYCNRCIIYKVTGDTCGETPCRRYAASHHIASDTAFYHLPESKHPYQIFSEARKHAVDEVQFLINIRNKVIKTL